MTFIYQVSTIGIDSMAKNLFQLHWAHEDGSVAFRKRLTRKKLLTYGGELLAGILVASVVFLFACASITYAQTNELPSESRIGKSLPGEACRIGPSDLPKKWTEPEKWAWREICEGRIANFNERYNEPLDPRNPQHDHKWSDGRRTLSSDFLESILLHEPFRSAIPDRGIVIVAAYFDRYVNLHAAVVHRPLLLMRSLFNAPVYMNRAKVRGMVSFKGSKFKGQLNMDSASIRGDLLLKQVEFEEVYLRGSEIGGQVSMIGSTFNGPLNMDSVTIRASLLMYDDATFSVVKLGGSEIGGQVVMIGSTFNGPLNMDSVTIRAGLFMRNGATFAEVILRGSEIGGQVSMNGSTFNGPLNMDSVKVGASLLMQGSATFAEVHLVGAEIGGPVAMDRSTFNGPLIMDSVTIGTTLFLRNAIFNKEVQLTHLNVGANLDARGAKIGLLDLSGSRIARELRLGSTDFNIKWNEYKDKNNDTQSPRLRLLNTTVGTIQDTKKTWPPDLKFELEGFTYTRLSALGTKEDETPFDRGADWFIEWMERDGSFSPQPYRQLAKVLDQTGYDPIADEIHYALQDRVRTHENTPFFTKALLTMSWLFLGYGYEIWRALVWFLGLVVLGICVISIAENGRRKSLIDWLFFSLESAVPLIDLTPSHQKFLRKLPKWVNRYFLFHKIFGLIIVSVLIAGMAGLVT